jgi:hypothetical protein
MPSGHDLHVMAVVQKPEFGSYMRNLPCLEMNNVGCLTALETEYNPVYILA